MKTIREFWEKRSGEYGNRIEGVVYKSLPQILNSYIDRWMYGQVKSVAGKGKLRILDLGCGYGRISRRVLQEFPEVRVDGIDIAQNYVDIYNRELAPRGRALRGDIQDLPFPSSCYDVVFIATTLMYLTRPADQKKALRELFRVLKPQGKFVIIERNPAGQNLVTLGGLITRLRGKRFQEIPSVGFRKDDMLALIRSAGGITTELCGLPVFTIFLPCLILLSMISGVFAQKVLGAIMTTDRHLGWLLTPSLYIAYIGAKREKN